MTVYLRRDTGKYVVHFTYKHSDGRKEEVRESTPFTVRKQAESFERQLRSELLERDERPSQPPVEAPKFAEYADEFLRVYARVENKPSEVDTKEKILRNHLKPEFGKKRLNEITKADIKAYRSKKLMAGYAPKTINNHVAVLTKLLAEAEEGELIQFVPRVRRMKLPPAGFDFLTVEEANALIEAADEEWRTMIIVALRTGLRQGELLGLQWQDVNLEKGFLVVRRSVFRGRVGSPKSNKGRVVPLCDEAIQALVTQRHSRGPYVFCDRRGELLSDNQCKHPLERACLQAELRRVGWHVLRHTFASHLIQCGVNIVKVQQYLGHSDIRVTMRYAHLNPDMERESVKVLDRYSTPTARNVIPFRKLAES